MKYFRLVIFCLIFINCNSQDSNQLIIQQDLISDLSKYPIYPQLTEEVNGKVEWTSEFAYLDDIEIYTITYMSDGLKVKGLLVKPKKEGNYPSIIYNRGGNRDFGALVIAHGAITFGKIAKEGYVVIASQYRGNAGGEGMEEFGGKEVNDISILTEVLKEVESADTENIGMYGWSRGGMMTYIALTKMKNIKAAVVGGAVSDISTTIEDRPEMETNVIAELIPEYEKNKEIELEKRSAINWADKFPKDTPILMLHGTSDWRVKPEQSLKMALEFEKYRVPYRLIMFEGGDHGISEHKDEVNSQVISWFDRYLKNGEKIPDMEYHGR
ncbi:alpha/beta hydrolase family protein [Christiangramia sp. SM2212]|uniref:Prolyl oligopeptidase family serine peptidase n=1 Tax=Christiangramia sediminicola TaxID=3073267 RepID=A0ABU1ENH0_9FLAO|nr:prolyl oligopeptidase family serine peptidase [Christiangramia sp. SM2212]MDR5589923.1 prolyl oligopeptidase family serine peptidase [Christiangramia sp. SM2212]